MLMMTAGRCDGGVGVDGEFVRSVYVAYQYLNDNVKLSGKFLIYPRASLNLLGGL